MKKGAGERPFLWSDDQAGQVCGDEAWLTVTDPKTERGMEDYRLDQREDSERHPAAVDRLLGRRRPAGPERWRAARQQGRPQLRPRRRRQDDKASSAAGRYSRSTALIPPNGL